MDVVKVKDQTKIKTSSHSRSFKEASMRCFFCGSFLLFVFIVMSVSCSLVVICWERADLLARLYLMFSFVVFCHFPIWCPGSGVVLNCIDS